MDGKKMIAIISGIGLILLFLASFIWSKSSLDIFNISLGVMILIFVFYNENKKISYLLALFCVNIVQWLILIYIFYYNQVYITTEYFICIIGALIITLILVNQIRKNHLKSPENGQKAKINILKYKTKLILLFTGVIIIMGSLTGFIFYYAPIFLYGIIFGLMVFIYGFYHEDKKVNVSVNYARAMGSVLILQWIILFYFIHQISKEDWVQAFTLSTMIAVLFLIQIYRKYTNEQMLKQIRQK